MMADGVKEGIARMISQSVIFNIERIKTIEQLGMQTKTSLPLNLYTLGMATSSFTAGLVYFVYYSILDITKNNILASFGTSLIKTPIANCMRTLHAGYGKNIIESGKYILRNQRMRGMYNGYRLSLIEDTIEMYMRDTFYGFCKNSDKAFNKQKSVIYGGLSGAIISGILTPFDTMKCRMLLNRDKILSIGSLYSGSSYKMLSNATKFGMFYLTLELLSLNNK